MKVLDFGSVNIIAILTSIKTSETQKILKWMFLLVGYRNLDEIILYGEVCGCTEIMLHLFTMENIILIQEI